MKFVQRASSLQPLQGTVLSLTFSQSAQRRSIPLYTKWRILGTNIDEFRKIWDEVPLRKVDAI